MESPSSQFDGDGPLFGELDLVTRIPKVRDILDKLCHDRPLQAHALHSMHGATTVLGRDAGADT